MFSWLDRLSYHLLVWHIFSGGAVLTFSQTLNMYCTGVNLPKFHFVLV